MIDLERVREREIGKQKDRWRAGGDGGGGGGDQRERCGSAYRI